MTELTLHEESARENNIIFFNGGGHTAANEVMRISTTGITVNPKMSVDEAADAVIRVLDGYIKVMVSVAISQERKRLADALQQMPLNDTANSIAIWIRNGGKDE